MDHKTDPKRWDNHKDIIKNEQNKYNVIFLLVYNNFTDLIRTKSSDNRCTKSFKILNRVTYFFTYQE